MEDTGKLVQMGWSAGSRSAPHFDWARNITASHLSNSEIATSNKEASSLFAYTWQMMRNILPAEVVADFNNYIEKSGLPRMNGNGQMDATYQVFVDGKPFSFSNVELAPPGAVIAENYSR